MCVHVAVLSHSLLSGGKERKRSAPIVFLGLIDTGDDAPSHNEMLHVQDADTI